MRWSRSSRRALNLLRAIRSRPGRADYQMASGTNHYHGDLFETTATASFDSVGFFNGPAWGGSNTPAHGPREQLWLYGRRPISILRSTTGVIEPGVITARNGTSRTAKAPPPIPCPRPLEKTGDFTDFVNGSTGALIPIYDPLTGQQFVYNGRLNVIPPSSH